MLRDNYRQEKDKNGAKHKEGSKESNAACLMSRHGLDLSKVSLEKLHDIILLKVPRLAFFDRRSEVDRDAIV